MSHDNEKRPSPTTLAEVAVLGCDGCRREGSVLRLIDYTKGIEAEVERLTVARSGKANREIIASLRLELETSKHNQAAAADKCKSLEREATIQAQEMRTLRAILKPIGQEIQRLMEKLGNVEPWNYLEVDVRREEVEAVLKLEATAKEGSEG
jgi:hypothetical protein